MKTFFVFLLLLVGVSGIASGQCFGSFSNAPKTICAGDSMVLSFTNHQGEPTACYWFNVSTGQQIGQGFNFIVYPTQSTSYVGVAYFNGGCSLSSAELPVTVHPKPTVYITSGVPVCEGQNTQLFAVADFGSTYLWSNGQTTSNITVNSAGNYSVTVTNSNGCTATATKEVINLSKPVATINSVPGGLNVTSCDGKVNLTAGGGLHYYWSNGYNGSNLEVTTSGTYIVTVTNANGCTAIAAASVTVNTTPDTKINGLPSGSPLTLCVGASAVLTASPGSTYLWSTGATTQSITVTSPGFYQVIVSNGICSSVAEILVTYVPNPTAVISGDTEICQGEKTTLTASGGSTYKWSTGATTNQIDVNQAGEYKVTVTNANGCTAVASTTVTVNFGPHITFACQESICSDATTPLTVNGGVSWIWSTGETTQTITVGPGTYAVTATSANGCTSVGSVTILGLSKPTPTITVSSPSATTVTLTSSFAVSYKWSTGSTSQSISLVDLPAGLHTYSVTVTDWKGCTGSASYSLFVKDCPQVPPVADFFGSPDHVCVNEPVTFVDLSTNAEYWVWSFPGGTPSSFTGEFPPSVYYSQAGTYPVSLTVTNTGGSDVETKSSYITVTAGPPSAANFQFLVNGKTVQFQSGVPVGTPGLTYLWNFGDGSTSNLQNPTHTYAQAGTYTVTLTITNQCGVTSCPKVVTIVQEKPQIKIWADKYETCFCSCEWFTLYSTSLNGVGYTINWRPVSYLYYNNPTQKNGVETQDAQWLGVGSHTIFADIYDLQGGFVETLSLTFYVNNCVSGGGEGSFRIISENLITSGSSFRVDIPENDYNVYVYDMVGKTVVSRKEASSFQITTDGLPSGMYILHVITSDGEHQDRKKFQIIN